MISRSHPLRERFDAFLVDLDGTLLAPDGSLTPRTRRAVAALVASGVEVLLCTGRSLAGAQASHEALGLATPVVAYNGAWIGHPGEPPWRRTAIPDPLVPEVVRIEERAEFSFRHDGARKVSLVRDHPSYDRVASWYTAVVRTRDPALLPRSDLVRVSCYFDDRDRLEEAWRRAAPPARDALQRQAWPLAIFAEFADSPLLLLEVQGPTRGKAEALDWLAAERGIPSHRVVAVGDHQNDVPMLRASGFAVVVGNAAPEARAVADLVIGHHAEEGVAAWLEAGAPLVHPAWLPAAPATGVAPP
jgi:hypothetical protein